MWCREAGTTQERGGGEASKSDHHHSNAIEDLKRLRRGIGTEKKEGVFPSALGHPATEKGRNALGIA